MPASTSSPIIAIRLAGLDDAADLRRLAALDAQPVPRDHDVLLAVVDGQPRAALGLGSEAVVADPFHPTADLVELLRVRAALLRTGAEAAPGAHLLRTLLRRPAAA